MSAARPKNSLANAYFETLQPYVPGKPVSETQREQGLTDVIKLASNENPLGPSPLAVAAVQKALTEAHDYPDGGCFYLKRRLAKHLGLPTDWLMLGNGTNEIIEMLVRTFLLPGESMVYSLGTFVIYKLCAQAAGKPVKEVLLKNFTYNLDAMAAAMDEKTKLVFIANPNNPTGTYVGKEAVEEFLNKVPEHVIVVLDEAYCEYVTAPDYPNGLDYLQSRERFMVLRTFSKAYGLAGFRVGYGVGNPTLIDYLNRGRQPFNVNAFAQVAAQAALDDTEHLQNSVELNSRERPRVAEALRGLGCTLTDSQANFVFADFAPRSAQSIFEDCLKRGVIIRPMGGYGFPNAARITIGTEEQNNRLIAVLAEVLGGA